MKTPARISLKEAEATGGRAYAEALRASAKVDGDWAVLDFADLMPVMKAHFKPTKPFSFPPLTVQAKNFVAFAGRTASRIGANAIKLVKGDKPDPILVPAEVKAARQLECTGGAGKAPCPNYEGGRCRLCGCGLDMLAKKLAWATERCPDNPPKWVAWNGPLTGS